MLLPQTRFSWLNARLPRTIHPLWLVIPWWGFLFIYGLDSGTLYRTEALRAVIGRECLHGQWLVPMLYGEPFLTKPPGMYVAIALASLPNGEVTTGTARIPSIFAAMITLTALLFTFRRAFGDTTIWLVGLLAPISLMWLDKVPSAEIDMLQVAWVSVAILAFWRAVEEPHGYRWWGLSLLAVTLGFLTKWTAPAFFYLTALPYLALRGRLHLLYSREHLIGSLLAIGTIAAWVWGVVQSVGWSVLADTVGMEAMQRFDPHHAGRAYPIAEVLLFPFQAFAAGMPWSLLALATLRPRFWQQWDDRGKSLLLLFHCWTWPNLLFWTILPEHAVRYVFPMMPGWIGLGLMVLIAWSRDPGLWPSFMFSPRRALCFCLLAWITTKVIYVEEVMPGRTLHRQARETAAHIRDKVPANETLHLFRLKDEGIMFYYGSNVQRLHEPPQKRTYVMLTDHEWRDRAKYGVPIEFVDGFLDQQGDRIVLAIMGSN